MDFFVFFHNVDAATRNYAEGESRLGTGELRPVVALSAERISRTADVPTARELGIDALASTVHGFAVLLGVPDDRQKILSDGLVSTMEHSVYQSYLATCSLLTSIVTGQAEWNTYIERIYTESESALKDLGLIWFWSLTHQKAVPWDRAGGDFRGIASPEAANKAASGGCDGTDTSPFTLPGDTDSLFEWSANWGSP